MPYAIVQGGLLLSVIVLVLVAAISLLSAFWIVEVRDTYLRTFLRAI